jgi:hypothetical protein
MKDSKTEFIHIIKPGKLHEHDIVDHMLEENSIPFYMQSKNSSGLCLTMPFQPTQIPRMGYSILASITII